jgi:anti-sigma factor RsiW
MTEQSTELHLSLDELLNYFSPDALPEKQDAVEQHLAVCDACAQLGRQVYTSTLLVDRWSKGGARLNAAPQILYPALLALIDETADATWKERLKNWAERWRGRAEGVLRIVWGAGASSPVILTEGLEATLRPQALWHFELQQAPSLTPVRGTSTPAAPPIAIAIGTPGAKVAISGEAEEIEIRIDNIPPGISCPLVLLCPVTQRALPRVRELRKVPGTSYLIARFEGVGRGDYLVALEPVEH